MHQPIDSSAVEILPTIARQTDAAIGEPPAGNKSKLRRLHQASLWLPCAEMCLGLVLPAIIGSIFLGPFRMAFFLLFFVVLPAAAFHTYRYFTLQFRFDVDALIIESGWVFRRERRIPFERVQETEIQQGILYRLLDLAKLDITTAGSDAQEAQLNVLQKSVAEHIKRRISSAEATTRVAEQAATPENVVYALTLRDLVLGGVTSKLVASIGAVLGAVFYFRFFLQIGNRWSGQVEEQVKSKLNADTPAGPLLAQFDRWDQWALELGPLNFLSDFLLNETLAKSIAFAFFGLTVSIVLYVVRYYDFRLTRQGELLGIAHGLLTLRRGSLARDRIQALKLEESLLRRWFGLAAIRVDSAGDRKEVEDQKKKDVLLPVAPRAEARRIAGEAMPGLDSMSPDWQSMSPLAVMRGTKKGWLLVLLAMVQVGVWGGWYSLMLLPAFPGVYFLNRLWYRNTGFSVDRDHFLGRSGWLNRATVCLPIKNIQNVSVRQSFFDRRLGLASLVIDTAGQTNTGGGPRIRHLPVAQARNVQQVLVHQAAQQEFHW